MEKNNLYDKNILKESPKIIEEIPEKIIEVKSSEFRVLKKEDDSAILSVQGWRMRVYFDKGLTDEQKDKVANGKYIAVNYVGNLEDVFSIQLQHLNKI